jgi:hypothetical protein
MSRSTLVLEATLFLVGTLSGAAPPPSPVPAGHRVEAPDPCADTGDPSLDTAFAAIRSDQPSRARPGVPEHPDVSQCDNCNVFPKEFLEVDDSALLDLASLPPERRLDFLVGEWELIFPADLPEQGVHYTADQPIGFEIIDWFVEDRILEAFQEWPFTNKGGPPFRAKTDFRYVAEEDRWQMVWLTVGASGVFTGGLGDGGVFAFYEHEFTGGRRNLELKPGMRYVFRNITTDTFIAEEYRSSDGGETFDILKWQLLYRRRRGS